MDILLRSRSYLFILPFLLVGWSTWAQHNQVRFEYINSEQGLSANVVNCIFQDSQGFMWFGTNDGLNRYDGYHFTTFKSSPDDEQAINSNLVFAIAEDGVRTLHQGSLFATILVNGSVEFPLEITVRNILDGRLFATLS